MFESSPSRLTFDKITDTYFVLRIPVSDVNFALFDLQSLAPK